MLIVAGCAASWRRNEEVKGCGGVAVWWRGHGSGRRWGDCSQDGFITLKHACNLTSTFGFMNY